MNPLAAGLNLSPGLKTDASSKEIEEAMKRVREAQSLISAAIEPGSESSPFYTRFYTLDLSLLWGKISNLFLFGQPSVFLAKSAFYFSLVLNICPPVSSVSAGCRINSVNVL